MNVDEDFATYTSGVLSEPSNPAGYQAVKIIGFIFYSFFLLGDSHFSSSDYPFHSWGQTGQTPYWIIENRFTFRIRFSLFGFSSSYGSTWGMDGYAYVERGKDGSIEQECYFFPPCEDLEWF